RCRYRLAPYIRSLTATMAAVSLPSPFRSETPLTAVAAASFGFPVCHASHRSVTHPAAGKCVTPGPPGHPKERIIRAAMTSKQPSLSSLIGQRISLKIPLWKENTLMVVSLVGVETGGIWIESEQFMEELLAETPYKMTQAS